MYSTPTLLTILAFLALINIVIIISLYRVNRKRKQQNEKLISGWQLQNQYMDRNVESVSYTHLTLPTTSRV